jgi:F-type H+-transporting ATPase subunit gamma
MAVSTRLIQRRIKSIKNTHKITKAMELVAASKMKKSVQMTLASRAYAYASRAIVDEIMHLVDPSMHALLTGKREGSPSKKESLNTLVLVCSSDKGLCGGFNTNCLRKTFEFLRSRSGDALKTATVGRKANGAVKRAGFEVSASFEAISNAPSYERSRPVGSYVVNEFVNGNADRVFAVYMDYQGALRQVATVEQLLPLIPEHAIAESRKRIESGESDIAFEPDPRRVLDALLPKLVETRVYQALLESSASEHSSRMMAMQNATDNASGMIDDLTLAYNQARQAGITQEISEISAGKAALE